MSDCNDPLDAVIRVLRQSLSLPGGQPVDAGTRLLKAGLGLDSVAILEFVMALEKQFGIRIDDQEMDPLWLSSVGTVATFIDRKLALPGA